mgnify:CR=1 FL=1
MKKLTLILCLLALAAFGVAACGDDDDDDGGTETAATQTTTEDTGGEAATGNGGGSTVKISAAPDGSLAYEQTEVSASAGEVTIEFDNPASVPHDVVVESDDGDELIATDEVTGDQTTASGELEPGEYTFYCSVPGHRQAGMEGTLKVD